MRGTRSKGKRRSAPAVTIDGERNALQREGEIRDLPQLLELAGRHARQFLIGGGIMRAGLPGRLEHLVKERTGVIVPEQVVSRELCLLCRQER